jgi:hypothetical protein
MKDRRILALAVVVVIAIATLIFVFTRRGPEARRLQGETVPTPTPVPGRIVLFFVGENGRLRRENRAVPDIPEGTIERAQLAVDELLAGSQQGLASPFPWAVSRQALFIDRHGNAYVDFSPPPSDTTFGTASEIAFAYATVNTIVANCSGVERVQLLFGGREIQTLGHLDLSRPLAPRPELITP